MDPRRFDTLVRSLGRAATRRGALAALLAGLASPLVPDLAGAKRGRGKGRGNETAGGGHKDRGNGKGKGKGRGKARGKSQHRKQRGGDATAAVAKAGGDCREAGHPCEGNQECCANLICAVSGPGSASRCTLCGDSGERCCANGDCNAGHVCTADDQCVACGADGQLCCTEGAACTSDDPCLAASCQDGTCTTTPKDCSGAGDECNVGVCRQSDGACIKRPKQDGAGCNADNDSCTVGDSCQNGVCTPGAGVTCGHLDDPCNRGVCQPDGSCARQPRNDDELCLAGRNFCTDVGACRNGSCVAGPAVVCTASDDCHVAGVCDPETGRCSNPEAANGTTCGANGRCANGRCVELCLPVRAVCDPATDTCCDSEGDFCSDTATCREGGEPGRCCRPEGAFCEQPCDCCGGVCAGGVCCVPNQQCTSSNECCGGQEVQECIDGACKSVCGTDRAFCDGGAGSAPCCEGYRCVDNECWPENCTATTEECENTVECCPDGVIICAGTSPGGNRCCHPYNQTCRDTDECCDVRVCGPESKCCLSRPFDPDRHTAGFAICRGREHECCPGLRCKPFGGFCCVDEGQPVPQPSPQGGGFIECCHFAERDGVCICHRDGETCSAPFAGNAFFSSCCDGLVCFDNVCQPPCAPLLGLGCRQDSDCCRGLTCKKAPENEIGQCERA